MSRNLRLSIFALLFITFSVSGPALFAQDPAQPAPAPDQNPPAPAQQPVPDKSKDKPADPRNLPSAPEPDKVGKSKLEKETGTVNDRIFTVMPNYGTVETAGTLPPMTTGQKFRTATASAFDYFAFPFNAALAGIDQANNSPKSWGQGWGAYGKRFGASFADNSIGTYMTVAIFPSILKEDPRYYQLGKGGFKKRAWHGVSRLFVTRTDAGGTRFNYSEAFGNASAAAFSNVYHAEEDRTLGRNLETYGMLYMWDGLSNELKEFWPDIRRKVFRKKDP